MVSLAPGYVPMVVTSGDIKLASIAWGFSLGVGALTSWKAFKQTLRIKSKKRIYSIYVWMIWGEIAACLVFSIICWLHLNGNIPPSFGFYFAILTCWSIQVQLLLQIIINRIAIIELNPLHTLYLRWGVAAIVTAINISVYCIWIPARLQTSEEYIEVNDIWDRCEKSIYLVIDGLLNLKFIWTVRMNLVKMGLDKYRTLMNANIAIVVLSLSMDVLIIAMMSLNNTFVYSQFHPLAYIVKLHIELHLADLIADIAKRRDQVPTSSLPINSDPQNLFKHFSLDNYPRHTNTYPPSAKGIRKTQDVSVETFPVNREYQGSDSGGKTFVGSGPGSRNPILGGGWAKCTVEGGEEQFLREGEIWDGTVRKGSVRSKLAREEQDFPS